MPSVGKPRISKHLRPLATGLGEKRHARLPHHAYLCRNAASGSRPRPADGAQQTALDAATAGRFAGLALDCVHREYPNKIAHVMAGDQDVLPPRELTPAFYGCYDWHSSVHGHWLLARLARVLPQAEFATPARAALATSLTAERLAGEATYLEGPGRISFERPYGLAWLLQLAAELRGWDDEEAQLWAFNLGPLERQAAQSASPNGCPSWTTRSAPASTRRPPSPSV